MNHRIHWHGAHFTDQWGLHNWIGTERSMLQNSPRTRWREPERNNRRRGDARTSHRSLRFNGCVPAAYHHHCHLRCQLICLPHWIGYCDSGRVPQQGWSRWMLRQSRGAPRINHVWERKRKKEKDPLYLWIGSRGLSRMTSDKEKTIKTRSKWLASCTPNPIWPSRYAYTSMLESNMTVGKDVEKSLGVEDW